jgi:SAM-dependent methyltransferase
VALVFQIIDFITMQDKLRPIVGDVLFIGKQETFGRTLSLSEEAKIQTMDWSPHFGADFVWDLGKPVPGDLCNRFDFIYDGGSLDNMWSPSQGLINMSRMLRPGGRMLCLACSSSLSWPYTMFSPGWFYDFFEENKFSSYETYLCSYVGIEGLLRGDWKWFPTSGDPNKNRLSQPTRGNDWLVVSIAEKGNDTTSDRQPIQFQYRPHKELVAA